MLKRIVIVGAGFAGAYTLKFLHSYLRGRKDIRLILVNERDYFLFTPLLPEAATGLQNLESIAEPLQETLCSLNKLYVTPAESVDSKNKLVKTGRSEIAYDYLVLALGASTNFYNIPGADKYSFTLKSLDDARALKNHLVRNFKIAAEGAGGEEFLNIVVVGGGAAGVEIAGEIADLTKEAFTRYYRDAGGAKVILLEAGTEVLAQMPAGMRRRAQKFLAEKGVEIILNKSVVQVSPGELKLTSGEVIKSNTVIWTAGVKPNQIAFDVAPELDKTGRIIVNDFLQIKGRGEIFALGDMAAIKDWQGQAAPAKAQAAVKEARAAAGNIARLIYGRALKKFAYRPTGELVSVGRWRAVGNIAGLNFGGRLAWCLRRAVDLSKLLSWRKKIRVGADWLLHIASCRDISEI